jgi:hypothetical protein
MEIEYEAGDTVPVTSALYCVVHDPPKQEQQLRPFYAGERFPFCPGRGERVRYALPSRVLRKAASN